eukprot:TRINITY_DN37668_c0_g1_i2.p1 TRINITY_DN37668_c0_g1~~TRINITY_DN37668_c0_g1_i2.p1  ORF type:complete len:824 (+),score=178.53 TRINITY_DN37668_c0_g1_i2:111-2474(+)
MAFAPTASATSKKRHAPGKLDTLDSSETPATTPGTTPTATPRETPDPTSQTRRGMDVDSSGRKVLKAGDVAAPLDEVPLCKENLRLTEVAQLLVARGQEAYLQGTPPDATVSDWLRGRPSTSFEQKALPQDQPIHEIFSELAQSLDHSFHMLVSDASGRSSGLLSPLAIARAMADFGPQSVVEGSTAVTSTMVYELMEPVSEVPLCMHGGTMQQLLQAIAASPARAALVVDERVARGLATPTDLLWAFHNQVCPSEDAWQCLADRPGLLNLASRSIDATASLQAAAEAMVAGLGKTAKENFLQHLVAVEPINREVVGLLSPSHLLRASRSLTSPVEDDVEFDQDVEAQEDVEDQDIPVEAEEDVEDQGHLKEREHVQERDQQQDQTQTTQKGSAKKKKLHRFRQGAPMSHPLTVADVATQRETAMISDRETLVDACDDLVSEGRTAAVVLDESTGSIRGLLTENDVLRAIVEGVDWDCTVQQWLRGGEARLPGFMLPVVTLLSQVSLADAALLMTRQAAEQDSRACHHLLVRTPEVEVSTTSEGEGQHQRFRLLSALDIARGMIHAAAAGVAAGDESARASYTAAALSVGQAMKPRAIVPACAVNESLYDAFSTLQDSQQNCALVVGPSSVGDDEAQEPALDVDLDEAEEGEIEAAEGERKEEFLLTGSVCGIITGADVLRAFSEKQSGKAATVGGWVRGLHVNCSDRTIAANARLAEAAAAMALIGIHHLLVVEPGTPDVIGVISALDIVSAIGDIYAEEQLFQDFPNPVSMADEDEATAAADQEF